MTNDPKEPLILRKNKITNTLEMPRVFCFVFFLPLVKIKTIKKSERKGRGEGNVVKR